jgi:chemotaxis signal transduction protein
MSIYKGIAIPEKLEGLINHMEDLEQSREEISVLSQQWDILTILGQITGSGTDMSGTRESFKALTEQLLGTLGIETLKKTTQSLTHQAQVAVDIVIRNLFERTADIGFLATDDDIREFLKIPHTDPETLAAAHKRLHERFAEYVAKYSVYNNIILLDPCGKVLCSLREDIAINQSRDPVIREAQSTNDAYVEFFRNTDLNPDDEKSLVYTYRVTETNDKVSKVLGVLCLVFKFKDELDMVFKNLTKEDEWNVVTLLDAEGRVIASSDESQIPLNAKVSFAPEKEFHVTKFGGRLYLSKTCATKGYQGYKGLGWYGQAMIPLEYAFASQPSKADSSVDEDVISAITQNEVLFSKELRKIPLDAQKIQADLDRTVWNGNVREEGVGSDATASARKVLLREISITGNKTRGVFEKSIRRLHETAVSSIFTDTTLVSSLAIDIMDRNLYERANDCRWWALTTAFRKALSQGALSSEEVQHCTSILKYINGLYTVYTNLFLFDANGKIIAVSNKGEERHVGKILSDSYIRAALADPSSQSYTVSPFKSTELYNNRPTYIFASSITHPEDHNQVVGGIGIVFDAEPQFRSMLEDSLPKAPDGSTIPGHHALFVDQDGVVVASTHPKHPVGSDLKLAHESFHISPGQSQSKALLLDGTYYAVGAACSKGYREYKGPTDAYKNQVMALSFTHLGKNQKAVQKDRTAKNIRVDYGNRNLQVPVKEFATFYINNVWMGFEKKYVVESIDMSDLTPIPGLPKAVEGSLIHQGQPLCVINPARHIGEDPNSSLQQIVIVRTEHGRFGIRVSALGEIPEVPEEFVVDSKAFGQIQNPYLEYLIKPAPGDTSGRMLLVMNPTKFFESLLGGAKVSELSKLAQMSQNTDNLGKPSSEHVLKAVGE